MRDSTNNNIINIAHITTSSILVSEFEKIEKWKHPKISWTYTYNLRCTNESTCQYNIIFLFSKKIAPNEISNHFGSQSKINAWIWVWVTLIFPNMKGRKPAATQILQKAQMFGSARKRNKAATAFLFFSFSSQIFRFY